MKVLVTICRLTVETCNKFTTQKMKFSIKDFYSKCDQIRRNLWIGSHLLKKSLMENFIFVQWLIFIQFHCNIKKIYFSLRTFWCKSKFKVESIKMYLFKKILQSLFYSWVQTKKISSTYLNQTHSFKHSFSRNSVSLPRHKNTWVRRNKPSSQWLYLTSTSLLLNQIHGNFFYE